MRSRDRLGMLTDLHVQPDLTRVLDRAGYRVVITESFPGYWFGNLVSLDTPPTPQDLDAWFEVARAELGTIGGLQKLILDWETSLAIPGDPHLWPAGTAHECGTVMTCPPRAHAFSAVPDVRCRSVSGDGAWGEVVDLACDEFGGSDFEHWRLGAFRRAVEAGKGLWWGAWYGPLLVASCGLFEAGDYLRFQDVVTRQRYRRHGICRFLCETALQEAWSRQSRASAVIVAERGTDAERLYRRLGFEAVGWQHALLRSI